MPEPKTLKIPGGAEVPLPAWAPTAFGVIAVFAISFAVYRHFYPVEPELISAQRANEQLQLEVNHYNLHIMDAPRSALADEVGSLAVRVFDDGCVIISQRVGAASSTRLLISPMVRPRTSSGLLDAVVPTLAAQGRCLNPHPGPFGTGYGRELDSCWIEVWRTFQDGCQHVQLFNRCNGSWASNPDGTPQVRWTQCRH